MNARVAIDNINFLKKAHQGKAYYLNRFGNVTIERTDNIYLLRVDENLDLNIDDLVIDFHGDGIHLNIIGPITSSHTSVDAEKKLVIKYSEGKISSFLNHSWIDQPSYFQSFYISKQRHLVYDLCGSGGEIILSICAYEYRIYNEQDYLVIECLKKIPYEIFSEVTYNVLIAIGFITGEFIQDEVFTFQYDTFNESNANAQGIKYRKLRPGFSSIYNAVASSPYNHSHVLDRETIKLLDENKTLKYLNEKSISSLVELSLGKEQIQYALVLFNEANGNRQSLLIKNNCFFAVLEVLKKYFYELFKTELPKNYSSEGNIKKYVLLFQRLIPITEDELQTIEKRNVFLHGDIKGMSGEEMVAVMQKQITLIYKLLLTHIGFDGHIIDHYAIARQQSLKSFIKLEQR